MAKIPLKSVLFDLDGTLLDTAPDLAFALNSLLQKNNRPPLPFELIRPRAGHGGKALIKLGFAIDETHSEFISLWKELLEIYSLHLTRETNLFPGMQQVLDFVEQQQLSWGIITNKPGWLTEPLLKKLNLMDRTCCVISGDTLPQRKPHPEPLLHACRLIPCNTSEAIYIGDTEHDIQAAKSAGLPALLAMFGYLSSDDQPHLWNADEYLQQPTDIIIWLKIHCDFKPNS